MKDQNEVKVEDFIEVRSEPHIYAFSTNTVPNYVKVGDTVRPIDKRIKEWEALYQNLQRIFPQGDLIEALAKVNDEVYFRDYAVHKYLESNNYQRLREDELKQLGQNLYFSNEFFRDVTPEVIKDGIADIKESYNKENSKYTYYKMADRTPTDFHYKNDQKWTLRDNQREVVNNFVEKIKQKKLQNNTDRLDLLMYAVMRFGKSFTAIYCAKEANYKKVLVVSAKADVATEWKKTVEKPECFKQYRFLLDKDFVNNANAIQDTLEGKVSKEFEGKDRVVVFLTLQNLSNKDASGKDIKKKLEQVFKTKYDLIIVDETHYGAWANTYGRPLKEEDGDYIQKEQEEHAQLQEHTKKLDSKIVLHLSGTPYNLLYENMFDESNIIATCQFSDILDAKQQWQQDHQQDIDAGVNNPTTGLPYEEYDNPYFGFPQMLRFAFNLPQSTCDVLQKMSGNWRLNKLFDTQKNKDTKVVEFAFENEVLKLLQIIDGKQTDDNILSFLDIPKIKDNDVCKHIVMVLPTKLACDTMENLLNAHKTDFNNLGNYNVVKVTGKKVAKDLNTVDKVKAKITEYEKNNQKTITLTVNRMLTGVTVPEWDTMIMLKNTSSPQEYDQAIFRIQNQYVKEVQSIDDNGVERVIKIDMKPQTILVDFDPIRMFELQGLSTQIVNKIISGEKDLDEKLRKELNYFPIITYNANKLVKVTPTNIIEIISHYNKDISILEQSEKALFDENLLQDPVMLSYIQSQSSKGISKGLSGKMHGGNEQGVDIPDTDSANTSNTQQQDEQNTNNQPANNTNNEPEKPKELELKYKKCIARMMFYAFLSKSNIFTVESILQSLTDEDINKDDNVRIFDNLQLDRQFIELHIEKCNNTCALNIDRLLQNANRLSQDESLSPEDRVNNALARFSRISESEIVTPLNICKDMYNAVGEAKLLKIVNNDGRILDIASKTGEFTVALIELLRDKVDIDKVKNAIYCIPTSPITYEFTRKIYEIMQLPLDHIADPYDCNTYKLLEVKKFDKNGKETDEIDYDKVASILTQNKPFNTINTTDNPTEGEPKVKFDLVVGNPPYQEDTSGNSTGTNPIYHYFMDISQRVSTMNVIITPARFLFNAGKTPKAWNKKMLSDKHFKIGFYAQNPEKVFSDIPITGGIAISIWNKNEVVQSIGTFIPYEELQSIISKVKHIDNFDSITKIIYIHSKFNLEKIYRTNPSYKTLVGNEGRDRRVRANAFEVFDFFTENSQQNTDIRVLGLYQNKRTYRYVRTEYLDNCEWINKYKVFVPESNGASGMLGDEAARIISRPVIGIPNDGVTQTFIVVGSFDTQIEANNLHKYILSKFCRLLLGSLKATQRNNSSTWANVPMQDFTNNSDIDWSLNIKELDKEANQKYDCSTINKIDAQLYNKYNLTKDEVKFIEKMIKNME